MNAKLTAVSTLAIVLAFVSQARAQGEKKGYFEQPVEAPTRAFEITVGTGYTQGFGSLQSGVDMANVITPGVGIDLGLGYRVNPHWAFMLGGQYQEFTAERAASARGFTAGLGAVYHGLPYTRTDPWVSLSSGCRMLWENPSDPNAAYLLTHGFELAKLTLGVDIRVDRDVAIAPVIGADLTLPLWQSVGGAQSVAINDPRVSTYVFAGVQGRFDITSTHEMPVQQSIPFEPPPQITQAEVTPPPPQPAPVEEKMEPVSPSISVSEELLATCKLHVDNVEKAPKFEFDKSVIQPQDISILQQIAECFTTGPFKDASMNLVGRADPRGTVKYNDALGMRRANAVGSYLEHLGVGMDRMDRSSRGERDAKGTDEASWAIDRRVDISLRH